MQRPWVIAWILITALAACRQPLPAQSERKLGADSLPQRNEMVMNDKDLSDALHRLSSEHGADRQHAIGWLCDHPVASRPALRTFFEPLENEWPAAAAMKALECIADPADVALIDSVLASGKLCFEASMALARNPSGSALTALLLRSDDPRTEVARTAIGGLGARGDESVRPKLEQLLGNKGYEVRWATVLAIDALGPNASRAALQKCLSTEKDKDIRHKIQEVLAH